MKRFFVKFSVFALALLLPFAAYFAYVQAQPASFGKSLMGGAQHKLEVLASTKSPKIVIIGGSGAPYAVISEDVQNALGMPCINLGTTAYLGLEFYFAQLKGNLGDGDIVIIAPEYSMYENGIDYETVWMAAENRASVIKKLPLSYVPNMLTSFSRYAKSKLGALKTDGASPLTYDEQYTAAGYGYWGDITFDRDCILESGYNTQDTRTVTADIVTDEVINQLNAVAAYAGKCGAEVYLTYATFDRLALIDGIDGVNALEARLEAECDIKWLGNLSDGVMDEKYFYNTNNHLNSEGAKVRTAALISDLNEAP
ncbi:MAG: hypothetical protein EOM30_00635 [Clostridia bacterium]|nr:hypothetical protein [Clostridia bacterium]